MLQQTLGSFSYVAVCRPNFGFAVESACVDLTNNCAATQKPQVSRAQRFGM
ncbi:hypothetical protein Terro_3662 [Terriglobus roseus DSM 18391]|uniref:Uncharacterized protein n=1 Tax=Terriglobus roseus (strain DSM 18391 / NRRL B-41598 / KBS 63) TaxID=926566 RepID=I3ZKV8_TERRK|nr:hypothetical protein Terro_3662 [Terriglobus roseus DSM 18391]